jgi:hypothetical protein
MQTCSEGLCIAQTGQDFCHTDCGAADQACCDIPGPGSGCGPQLNCNQQTMCE